MKKPKIKVAPSRFGSKLFRRGFTFVVALIQNEKIKVEHVAILITVTAFSWDLEGIFKIFIKENSGLFPTHSITIATVNHIQTSNKQ